MMLLRVATDMYFVEEEKDISREWLLIMLDIVTFSFAIRSWNNWNWKIFFILFIVADKERVENEDENHDDEEVRGWILK